jgi:hypothetical protein
VSSDSEYFVTGDYFDKFTVCSLKEPSLNRTLTVGKVHGYQLLPGLFIFVLPLQGFNDKRTDPHGKLLLTEVRIHTYVYNVWDVIMCATVAAVGRCSCSGLFGRSPYLCIVNFGLCCQVSAFTKSDAFLVPYTPDTSIYLQNVPPVQPNLENSELKPSYLMG